MDAVTFNMVSHLGLDIVGPIVENNIMRMLLYECCCMYCLSNCTDVVKFGFVPDCIVVLLCGPDLLHHHCFFLHDSILVPFHFGEVLASDCWCHDVEGLIANMRRLGSFHLFHCWKHLFEL